VVSTVQLPAHWRERLHALVHRLWTACFGKQTTRWRICICQGVLHVEQPERINLKPEAARMIIRICVEAILRAQSRRNQEQTAAQVASNTVPQVSV